MKRIATILILILFAFTTNAQNRLWGIANGWMPLKGADTQLFSTDLNAEGFQMYYSTDTLMPVQTQTRIPGCEVLVSKQNKKLYATQYDLQAWGDDRHFLMEYDRDSNEVTALVYFDSTSYPLGNLLEHSNGHIYGFLGWEGFGSSTDIHIYKYDIVLQQIDTLLTLNNLGLAMQASGFESEINLIEAPDGNIYGLTTSGGANNYGGIFMYDPVNNVLTKKLDFTIDNIPNGYFYQTNNNRILGSCANKVYEYDYINNTISTVFQSATDNVPSYLIEGTNNQFYGYYGEYLYDRHYIMKLDFNSSDITPIINNYPYLTDHTYPFDSPFRFIGRPSFTSNNTIVGVMEYSYGGEPGGCTAIAFEVRNDYTNFYTLSIKSGIGECQHLNSKLVEICYPQTVLQNEVILAGDSLFLQNGYQTIAGEYADTLNTFCGEDSVVVTNLVVADMLNYQTASICEGDTFSFEGSSLTTPGLYYETFALSVGDSNGSSNFQY